MSTMVLRLSALVSCLLLAIAYGSPLHLVNEEPTWNCSRSDAVVALESKAMNTPWPSYSKSPYADQTKQTLDHINKVLADESIVCAVKYTDDAKKLYDLKTFDSANAALLAGYFVTHQGICGACSTFQDLAIYLSTNLTAPVRKCGMKSAVSESWSLSCIKDLGFTHACAQVWMYNAVNTRKVCFGTCMKSWILNEPFTKPDGSLNDCLQCDEDLSGPVFKFYSGRTRRNSGIHSEIERPGTQIYPITHCYF